MIPANTVWVAVFVIVVMYVVARWVRSHTTTDDAPEEQVRYLVRTSDKKAADHLDVKGGLLLSSYSFRETDLETGPPDPADFYDELFIELKDPESGQTWQNSIHVATPRGLDRVMVEENWDTVIGTELLIVRRYDPDKILRGAIDHLQEIYEARVQIIGRPSNSQ